MHSSGSRILARRIIALSICALLTAVVLLSATFITLHRYHVHNTNGPDGACSTCVNLSAAQNLIRQVGYACAALAIVAAFRHTVLSLVKETTDCLSHPTPVSLHTRLNN